MEERINGNRDMDTGRDVCPWQAAGGGGEAVFRILFKRKFGSWKDCIYAGICRRSRCGRTCGQPDGDGVSLVEWGGLIEEIRPEDVITVKIEKDLEKGFDYRRITVEGLE